VDTNGGHLCNGRLYVEDVPCRLLCFCRCVVVHIQLHSLPMVPSLMKSISQALKQKKCHLVDRLLCCDCTHPGRRYPYLQSPGCGSFSLSLSLSLSLSHFCNSMTRAALCWGGRWRLWLWPLLSDSCLPLCTINPVVSFMVLLNGSADSCMGVVPLPLFCQHCNSFFSNMICMRTWSLPLSSGHHWVLKQAQSFTFPILTMEYQMMI
jgi:hypothetical protein